MGRILNRVFKPAPLPEPESRPVPPRRGPLPVWCGCCETRKTKNGLCDDCANEACRTFGH